MNLVIFSQRFVNNPLCFTETFVANEGSRTFHDASILILTFSTKRTIRRFAFHIGQRIFVSQLTEGIGRLTQFPLPPPEI